MKERYSGKVYRLSLSTGCTCPNRDGRCGVGGCLFCSGDGSGDFASAASLSIEEQIEEAKKKVASKISKNFVGYMAYFQSFTSTYARDAEELTRLRQMFTTAINHPEILELSIATRPDCLGDDIMEMLTELNHIKPVSVELGLQTSNDEVAKLLNRGYETKVYDEAVKKLHDAGINVVTHMIVGLPIKEENRSAEKQSQQKYLNHIKYISEADAIETARHVAAFARSADGIKIQMLQILKGTKLASMTQSGDIIVPEYSLSDYGEILQKILAELPEDMVVHRITGDPPKKLLISPLWTADKKKVLNYLRTLM